MDRGPIEARPVRPTPRGIRPSPRSMDRGPIETAVILIPCTANLPSPRSMDRGPIEAVPWVRKPPASLTPHRGPWTADPLKPVHDRVTFYGIRPHRGPWTADPLKRNRTQTVGGPTTLPHRGPWTADPLKRKPPANDCRRAGEPSPRSMDRGPIEAIAPTTPRPRGL